MAGHRGDAGPRPPWKSLAGAAPAADEGQTAAAGTALPNAAARARFLCVWGGHGEQLDQARLKETLLKRSACRGQQTAAENDWRDLTRSRYRGGVKRHQQNQASSFSVNY